MSFYLYIQFYWLALFYLLLFIYGIIFYFSHQMTVDIINGMDIDPMTEQTDFSSLCDNRDDSILFSCEPNKVLACRSVWLVIY